MANKLLAFRCPQDLQEQIEAQTAVTGKDKTAVVIDMLRQSLPSVSLNKRYTLPDENTIYFVYQANRLLYIGRTVNLLNRWLSHHRFDQLKRMEDVRIAWFQCDPQEQPVLENSLIDLLEPELNGTQIDTSGKKLVTFRIDGEVWEQFQALAKANGTNASKLLTDFVSSRLDDPTESSVNNLDGIHKNQIERLVVAIVEERTQAYAERLEVLEQRLGEFERLKAEQEQSLATDSDSYIEHSRRGDDAGAESNDYQQVLAERDQLEERVSDLLLEVENLKDENAVLIQTATDVGERLQQSAAASDSVQNRQAISIPLCEVRDRFLVSLKPLERKTAAKLLSRFLKFAGVDSHSPTA